MGAWGNGSFDNDDAADFLADVADGSDLALVRKIFATVLGAKNLFTIFSDQCRLSGCAKRPIQAT